MPAIVPRFAEILERVADGIVLVDRRGHIAYVTRRASELFGYEPEELIDQSVSVLVPEQARSVHDRVKSEYLAEPHQREMGTGLPLEGRRKDGSVVPLDIRLDPVRGNGFIVASVRLSAVASRGALAAERALADAAHHAAATQSVLDTVTQHLFAIGMTISALTAAVPAELVDRLQASTDLLDQTIEAARRAQHPSP